jgi:hypothetical protein
MVAERDTDVLLFFTTERRALRTMFPALARAGNRDGGLWVAWPKKSSGIENDLSFETVQRAGLDAGLVDNKSCSIDQDWQALRFVVRLRDR